MKYLRIAAISQLAVCAEIVLEGALGGAGHTVPPMLTSTALTASRIPLAAWAAARWGSARHLVGHLAHGDRPRRRDGCASGARRLEAQISVTMRPIITLLTDFGTADGYVGEMKGVLLSRAPDVADRGHHARYSAAGRRARAARRSRACGGAFPRARFISSSSIRASARRARRIAVASDGRFLVGPDNGVLSPALLLPGARVVELPMSAGASATFHGRDVFAPAAAALARGEPLDSLGGACTESDRSANARADASRRRRDRGRSDRRRPVRKRDHEPHRRCAAGPSSVGESRFRCVAPTPRSSTASRRRCRVDGLHRDRGARRHAAGA